jgi:hypothetical protein
VQDGGVVKPRPGPVQVRLSPVERATLEPAAADMGVPLSTYIKRAGLEKADAGAIVITGPAARLIREQAGLRGMAADELAQLLLAQLVAAAPVAGSLANTRTSGLYPCDGYDCCWASITAGKVPENIEHYAPCPKAR